MPVTNPVNSDLGGDALNQWLRGFRPRFTADLLARLGVGFGQQKIQDPLDFPLPRTRTSQQPIMRRPFESGIASPVFVPNSSAVDPGDSDPRDTVVTPGLDTTPGDQTTPGDESTPGEGTTPGDESTEGPGEETTAADGTTDDGLDTTAADGTTDDGLDTTPGDGPETPGGATTGGGDTPGSGVTTGAGGTAVIIGGGGGKPPWGGTPGEGQTGSSSSSSQDPCDGCFTEHEFNAAAAPSYVRVSTPPFPAANCTSGNPLTVPCGGGAIPGGILRSLEQAWEIYDTMVAIGLPGAAPPPWPRDPGPGCGCILDQRLTGFVKNTGSSSNCVWAELIGFTHCFRDARINTLEIQWWIEFGWKLGTQFESDIPDGLTTFNAQRMFFWTPEDTAVTCCNPANTTPDCITFRTNNTFSLNGDVCFTTFLLPGN